MMNSLIEKENMIMICLIVVCVHRCGMKIGKGILVVFVYENGKRTLGVLRLRTKLRRVKTWVFKRGAANLPRFPNSLVPANNLRFK